MENRDKRLEEAVGYMVRGVASRPDEVEVSQATSPRGLIVRVRIAERDKGRIIGRQGRNIQAMRALLAAGAQALGVPPGDNQPTIELDEAERG